MIAPSKPTSRDRARLTSRPGRFVGVAGASEILGLTTGAVRGRIKRGTLQSERRGGTVYVWISGDNPTDQPPTGHDPSQPADDRLSDQSELVGVLREQAEYLRDQLQQERDANRENRRIIAGLTQRIPQLEAPVPSDEPREAETGAEASDRGDPPGPERASERRSLWRRIFGGDR